MSNPNVYWAVRESRHENPPIYHIPDSARWSVFAVVDVARAIMADLPIRNGPNGPIDSVEPIQLKSAPDGRITIVMWRWSGSTGEWVRGSPGPSR